MRKSVKRVIAGVLSAVLSLSLVNFSALSMSLASELSGYEIGVEYSEDNTSATLVGNTTGVKEGVQLDKLVDSDGQELDPTSFSQTVEENGTYHFTLYYQETVETQDADQPTTEEKTQELEVVVNGIVEPKADQPAPTATPEVLEGVQMGTEDAKDAPSPFVQKVESMTAAPRTVPLNVLQRNMAQARAEKWVEIRAAEVDYKLQSVPIEGGPLVEGAEWLPAVDYRTFEYAGFVRGNGTSVFRITGLYNYNNKWYYTVDQTDSAPGFEDMGVGFQLPDDATVRLYYKIPDNVQKHMLTFNGGNASLTGDYNLTVNGGPDHIWLMYAQGTKIIIEFDLPPRFEYVRVQIPEVGFDGTTRDAAGEDAALQENSIKKVSEFRYTLMFTVPNQAVNINFTGTDWTDTAGYSVCLGTGAGTPQAGEKVIDTYFQTTGGTTREAVITHSPGGNGGTIDHRYKIELPISGNRKKDFSEGKYRAGSTLTLDMKMNRWYDAFGDNPYYTWKPTVLVLQVYLGTTFGGDQFREYYIPLQPWWGGHTDMTLDFGARVIADCTEWENQKYRYTITIENMYHNFAIYDSPVTTNNQNFMVVNASGIDMSVSTIEEADGEKPIALWSTYLGSNVKWSGSMNYFAIPMKGYTAPTFTVENELSTVTYHDRGWTSYKNNRYWLEIVVNNTGNPDYTPRDENKAPARISITAQPLTFTVNYYYNEGVYHETGVALSVDQSTNYSIQYMYPDGKSNIKGYYIEVYEGASKIRTITKSDGSLWMPNQDVINYDYIYDQLKNNGQLPKRASCELRVVAAPGDTTQGYVTAKYNIKLQNGYAKLDTNGNQWIPDGKYTPKEGTVNAYVGNWVDLIGIPDTPVVDGKLYKRIGNAGQSGGEVTGEGSIVGTLEYALATKVEVDTQTLGGDTNYETWVTEQTGSDLISTCYTSVNNLNHVMDWSGLTPGTQDGQVFNGWALKGPNGTMLSLGETTTVNLYNTFLDGKNSTLWSEIFGGTCTLVATWRSAIPVVTSADDTITNKPGDNITILDTLTREFEVVGTFKYGDGTASEPEINNAFENNQLKIALLIKDPEANGPTTWGVRYSKDETATFGDPVIKKADGSSTFTIRFGVNEEQHKISDLWSDGANFRIFAWTDSNSGSQNLNAAAIAQALNDADGANPYEGKVPSVNVFTKKVYKIEGKTETQNISATGSETSLQLTTTFRYVYDGARYPGTSFTQTMLGDLIGDGTIQVKLERRTTANGAWTVVNTSKKPITAGGDGTGTINFSYTLTGNIFDYHKNEFRVKVWTEANGTTEANYPYHTFTVNVDIKEVTLADGSKTNEDGDNITILDQVTTQFEVVGTFKYGDGTASQQEIRNAFDSDKLKIALLIKDPEVNNVENVEEEWEVRYSKDEMATFGEPVIEKADGSDTFTVTFRVNEEEHTITDKWSDGANFRVFAWTETNQGGADLTATAIAGKLNEAAEGVNPYDGTVPSVNVFTKKVYQIGAKTEEETVNPKATETDVALTTTFHYDFDAARYPNGSFTQKMLEALIGDGTIKVKLEKKTTATEDWSLVGQESSLITAGDNGTINFSYTLSGSILDYDNNQFRITVWTEANGSSQPYHTFTVKTTVEPIKYEGGAEGPVAEKPVKVNVGSSLPLEAKFRYGDGTTADEPMLNKLIQEGKIRIALLKMDPKIGEEVEAWTSVYGAGTDKIAVPEITKASDALDFTVSFQVSNGVNGQDDDGAQFRIVVWTDANGLKADGTSITGADIMGAMNNPDGTDQPDISRIPREHFNLSLLYQIQEKNETTPITAKATDDSVVLETTFHYNYDTARYPNGFDQGTLQTLIDNGDIQVKLERTTTADGQWSVVTTDTKPIIAGANGTISFRYTLDSNLYSYNNNQFQITVWTAANGDTHPSHTFTVSVSVEPIKNEGGASSSQPENVEGNVGDPLTLEASFRYGDGRAATLGQIKKLIDTGVIHIALVKIEPDKKPPPDQEEAYRVSWHDVQYGGDGTAIPKPEITQEKDAPLDFKISFQVSKRLSGWDDDGAQFRIYVWTEANGTSTDVSSITGTDIANDLNSIAGGADPTITEIPWVHYNLTLLYKVVNNGTDTSKTVSVLSTATSIPLTGTFKYEYDTNRYFWEQFTATMLQDLIDAKKFNVEIQVTKKGSTESVTKTLTPEEVIASLSAADNGIINFTYGFQDSTSTDLSAYDGATFEVKVSTAANGNVIPVYTITVTYIADPSTYVNIPEYVILEDDKSKVADSEGNLQDGYAGKSDQVSYKTSAGTQVKPEVTVKIKSGVKLRQGSHTGPEMQDMGIGIYDGAGKEINPESNGYSTLGTLSESNPTITFWMNVWRGGAMKNEQYYATVDYLFELSGTTT